VNDLAYLLWFIPEFCDEEDGLLIGVYTSEENAQSAITRLRSKLGFSTFPDGFQIHTRKFNQDGWKEGFTVENETPRAK
jgi:hypothetical protein